MLSATRPGWFVAVVTNNFVTHFTDLSFRSYLEL
jgi:hypothetical protein